MSVAKYSLLTLRPDPERLDNLCVGLVARHGSDWVFKLLPNTDKLKAIDLSFPSSRWEALSANLPSMLGRCATLPEARARLKQLGTSLKLDDFEGDIAYDDTTEMNRQLAAVMREMVLPASAPAAPARPTVVRGPRLRNRIKQQFERMGILGEEATDISEHKVVENFPVSTKHDVTAQFALRNGAMNFTETLDFGHGDEVSRQKKHEAQAKCFVLKTALEEYGSSTRCHVVVSTAGVSDDGAGRSVDLLSTVANIYEISNSADMSSYFAAMSRAAGIHVP